jgi:hypothetical protein
MTAREPQARVEVVARIGTERPGSAGTPGIPVRHPLARLREDAQDRVARASAIPIADHHGRGFLLE